MGKSKARKMREHDVRNGKRDVLASRGIAPGMSVHERKLPTLAERKTRVWNKRDKNQLVRNRDIEGFRAS